MVQKRGVLKVIWIRADFSLRENKTIIRKIEELLISQIWTNLITLKFSADYDWKYNEY